MSGEYEQEAQPHRPADRPGAAPGGGGAQSGLHPERLRGEPPVRAGPQQQTGQD